MRAVAVLTVRNEGAFLLEWLAHHRAVGFADFVVASNDNQDGTDVMLDRLAALGWLHHIPNPAPHEGGVQWAALKRADAHPAVRAADWLLALDIDEFVNIHAGDGTLSALLAAMPRADALTLTWRLFGNDGVIEYRDAPVTDQFTRAAPEVMFWPWRAFLYKTLYRNDGAFRKLGVHRPRAPDRDRAPRWVDGMGQPLPQGWSRLFSPFGRPLYGLVQLNHYPLGAMESFVLKADRGRAVHGADRLGLDYWVERNWCVAEDTSIARYRAARDAHLAELRADGVLDSLHRRAVDWRRSRFAELMREEPNRALLGRLTMTPPSRPLSPERAAILVGYARKGVTDPIEPEGSSD